MLKMLLPLDGSELAEHAISHARTLAASTTAKIVLLRVVAPTEFRAEDAFSRVDWRLRKQQAQSYLRSIAAEFASEGIDSEVVVEEGRPADVILETARRIGAKLLVMSSHGHGAATSYPHGGIASKVLSSYPGSVLLVGANTPSAEEGSRYRNILVPIDGTLEAECALRIAALLAQAQGARLSVVTVFEATTVPPFSVLDERTRQLCRELTDMTVQAAERKLASMRAQLPEELDLWTSVYQIERGVDLVPELVERYRPDLIVLSAAGPEGGPVSSFTITPPSLDRTPVLVLNPQDVGSDYCTLDRGEPPGSRTAV